MDMGKLTLDAFPWDKEQLEVRDTGTVRGCLGVPSYPFSLP